MINQQGLQPLNHSLSGLPQWVSERILQQINQLRRVRISTLRNENETFSQLNSITYIGVFCVW